jgi:hypothetical protein
VQPTFRSAYTGGAVTVEDVKAGRDPQLDKALEILGVKAAAKAASSTR